ncbi:MAG: permease-like cell division protein FtsX [Clostridium sp.]|nr:permease-like cell division protein FtsX [Clostridium sp.]
MAMKFDSFKYSIKDAFKSIVRNKTLSIASIATVTATLFILGVITLTVANVNEIVDHLGSMVEVKVYLVDDVNDTSKKAIESKIKAIQGVNDVVYESKEQALENVRGQLNDESGELSVGFEEKNPFPASYTVKVDEPLTVDEVVKAIDGMDGIDKIKDARSTIEKIASFTDSLKITAIVAFVIFILISLFLIGNTIKITVFTRKREIGIMKYVGATDWFIRWPFIIEGIILGIAGAFIAIILLNIGYAMLLNGMSTDMLFGFQLVSVSYVWKVVIWEFILCGVFIGSIGSILSMRKFLKV